MVFGMFLHSKAMTSRGAQVEKKENIRHLQLLPEFNSKFLPYLDFTCPEPYQPFNKTGVIFPIMIGHT